jgi:hypothetical protein
MQILICYEGNLFPTASGLSNKDKFLIQTLDVSIWMANPCIETFLSNRHLSNHFPLHFPGYKHTDVN